jgi:hypothetical protein
VRRVAYHWRHATRAALFFTLVHAGFIAALQTVDGLLGGPLGWINPVATVALAYLLFARQSYAMYAMYRGDEFEEWTPSFYRIGSDGAASISLRRYDDATDEFVTYGEAP